MDQNLRLFKLTRLRQGLSRFFGTQPPDLKSSFNNFSNIRSNKGSALVMAIIFMIVATTLITVGMKMVSTSASDSKQQQLYVGEAENVARAGLTDALGYFIRQKNVVSAYTNNPSPGTAGVFGAGISYIDQPFNPVNNIVNAQKSDTMDANIGIVNEYSVDSADVSTDANVVFFGRYEVKKVPAVVGSITPVATPDLSTARDITGNRMGKYVNGDGFIWSVSSTGYVYKRLDKTYSAGPTWAIPFNQAPNKIVATAKMTTEFRKLTLTLPPGSGTTWYAAVYCLNANKITLPANDQGILNGAVSNTTFPAAALGQSPACSNPVGKDAINCQGPPVTCVNSLNSPLADTSVFGMTLAQLQFLADYRADATNPLNIAGSEKLIYYNGNVTFGGALAAPYDRLCIHGANATESTASGILVVNGDLILQPGNLSASPNPILGSWFDGIIFCTGNLSVQDGCEINGCVIMGTPAAHAGSGNVTITGSAGNFGEITLNPAVISQALNLVAVYREDKTARKTLLAVPGLQ